MRALLLILTLTGLLAACSDSGNEPSDKAGGESAEQQDQKDSGQEKSQSPDLEAGQPVTKPSPPEPESSKDSEQEAREGSGDKSTEDSKDTTGANQNGDGSGKKVAASDIYDRYCVACHEQGMAGAPKLSNTAEWEKRIEERSVEGLVSNSWDGYRAMPAKGTCSDCSREELAATVKWMLGEAKVSF
jgi:cytochrome c5